MAKFERIAKAYKEKRSRDCKVTVKWIVKKLIEAFMAGYICRNFENKGI